MRSTKAYPITRMSNGVRAAWKRMMKRARSISTGNRRGSALLKKMDRLYALPNGKEKL